jgi:hypothetical protein
MLLLVVVSVVVSNYKHFVIIILFSIISLINKHLKYNFDFFSFENCLCNVSTGSKILCVITQKYNITDCSVMALPYYKKKILLF